MSSQAVGVGAVPTNPEMFMSPSRLGAGVDPISGMTHSCAKAGTITPGRQGNSQQPPQQMVRLLCDLVHDSSREMLLCPTRVSGYIRGLGENCKVVPPNPWNICPTLVPIKWSYGSSAAWRIICCGATIHVPRVLRVCLAHTRFYRLVLTRHDWLLCLFGRCSSIPACIKQLRR